MRKQLLLFFFLAFLFNILTVYAQPLTAICSGTNVTCLGGNNGTIVVSATGGVPPITGTGVFSLGAGTYCFTVTDNVGATSTCCNTVTEPCALSVSCSGTNASCFPDGTACASATCGTPPYYYLWTNGATGSCITNLVGGNYCVYVTDACNATATCCAIVSQPLPISITIQKINPSCSTCHDGSIQVTSITGGTGPYAYVWTPNVSSISNASGLSTGAYTVCVYDALGCSSCAVVTLTSPPPCSVTINLPVATVCVGSCVTLTANPTGSGPFTYLWMPGGKTTQTITVCPLVPTAYTVTVTDATNCTSTATKTVIVNQLPVITLNPPVSICSGDCVQLSAAGGFTYSWIPSTCLGANQIFCCTTQGTYTYTVIVTDGNGCTNNGTTSITVNPLPVVVAASPFVCAGTNAPLNATPGFISYSWIPSTPLNISNPLSSSPIVINPPAGTYTLTVVVTDGKGCLNDTTTSLIVNPLPLPVASPDITICIGHSVQLSASGGITCTWNPTSGLSSATGSVVTAAPVTTTTYTVTVTDGFGCKDTAHTTVTIDPCVNVNIISKDEGISFYPNPNDGLFYISLNKALQAAELTIFNVIGERVYEKGLTPAKEGGEIPVHLNVAAGIYFVQVRSGEGVFTRKVVVE